jgi:hypothetical protein
VTIYALPIDLREACAFVDSHHRHNTAPRGGKFAIGASDGARLVGVAIASRPIARCLDDGATIEVVRCCVLDDAPRGACSFLYARCWQAAKAMGYRRVVTYTLQAESGASLRGAGWRVVAQLDRRDPDQWRNRPGREWHAVVGQAKLRWEAPA